MKRVFLPAWIVVTFAALAVLPGPARAQDVFQHVTGKDFDRALPRDFYLEGNAIPTQKRNAAMLKTAEGAGILFSLIDTTGYSSQVQEKYIGMLITEAGVALCGEPVEVGSYGFGLKKPAPTSDEDATFYLYDQGGKQVTECSAKKDTEIKQPTPLQVVLEAGKPARLYLGRYWLEVE